VRPFVYLTTITATLFYVTKTGEQEILGPHRTPEQSGGIPLPPGGERSRRRRPPSSGSRVQAIPLTKKKKKKKGKKGQVQARRARRRARRTSRAPPAGTGGRFGPGGQSPDGKGEACRGPSACHVGRSPPVLPICHIYRCGRAATYLSSLYPLSAIYLST
jgi:hypothetical protein